MRRPAVDVESLREAWRARWPEALALWGRYTRLAEPLWCATPAEEKAAGLSSSFAMIRLDDHAIVISLRKVLEHGVDAFPVEVMAHEIGHHVLTPGDLHDHARMLARMRHALAIRADQAPFVANLYTDLLINDRLQRSARLRMAQIYRALTSGASTRLWTLYMRVYENLWELPRNTLALTAGEPDKQLEFDARLGARLVRSYATEWLEGSGPFAMLCLPYLLADTGGATRKMLLPLLDTENAGEGGELGGLAEVEPGEQDAVHPAQDPKVNGIDGGLESDSEGQADGDASKSTSGYRAGIQQGWFDQAARARLPQPNRLPRPACQRRGESGPTGSADSLLSGRRPPPHRAVSHPGGRPRERSPARGPRHLGRRIAPRRDRLVRDGRRESRDRSGPDHGEAPVRVSGGLLAGTPPARSLPGRGLLRLDDEPGARDLVPVIGGAIMVLSALRANARVMVALSGEPGKYEATKGFISDETDCLRVLTGYLGTGYTFGIPRLRDAFASRRPHDPPAHIVIVTDYDIFTMLDGKDGGRTGWQIAADALATARGGGSYLLHSPYSNSQVDRMRQDGWDVHFVTDWSGVVAFAQAFSAKHYGGRG